MLTPQLFIFTGSFNRTDLIIKNVYNLVRNPTYDLSKSKNFHWKISPHWEDGGTKEDFIYKAEGFDKIGYLRLWESQNYLFVNFIPKKSMKKVPYLSILFLLSRFAFFLKRNIKEMPHEFNLTIR